MANNSDHFQRNDRMTVNGFVPKNPACVLCRKTARSCCQRCGDFYCSLSCQNIDWPSHRYICFRMPVLVPYPEVYSNSTNDIISLPEKNAVISNQLIDDKNNKFQKRQQNSQQEQPHQIYKQFMQQQEPQQQQQQQPKQQLQQQQPPPLMSQKVTLQVPDFPLLNSTVIIVGFRSTNMFFIVSSEPSVLHEYDNILKLVAKYGQTAKPLQSAPSINSYVVSEIYGKYNRAFVKAVVGQKYRLHFIDIGTESFRHLNEMRQITPEIQALKKLALPILLRSVPMKTVMGAAIKFFESKKNQEYQIVYEQGKNNKNHVRVVELFNRQTGTSLSEQIMQYFNKNGKNTMSPQKDDISETCSQVNSPEESKETVHDTSISSNATNVTVSSVRQHLLTIKKSTVRAEVFQSPLLIPPFAIKKWNENLTNVRARITDTSTLVEGIFSCAKSEDVDHLQEIIKFFENYEPNNQPYVPIVSEYCLGLFEDKWYRARCISANEDNFTVVYIDFGNEVILEKHKIRPYPVECTLDCRTITCVIAGRDI